MICKNCGQENSWNGGFCINCGAKIDDGQAFGQNGGGQNPDMYLNQPVQPTFNNQPMYGQPMYNQPAQPVYNQPVVGQAQMLYNSPYAGRVMPPRVSVYRPNIIGIIASIAFIISAYMPVYTVSMFGYSSSTSISELHSGDAALMIFFALFTLAFSIADLNIVVIVFGSFANFIAFFYLNQYGKISSTAHLGAGLYVMLISAIALLVAGILGTVLKARRKNKAINAFYQSMR